MVEPFFSRRLGDKGIHYAPPVGLVYINNPKVACSTIKKTLWLAHDRKTRRSTFAGNPHHKGDGPFLNDMNALSAHGAKRFVRQTMFTAVRNPYVRLLSAYLDKIGPGSDGNVWHPFCRRFGFERDREVPFEIFVDLITQEPDYVLDEHFAPQYVNVGALLFDLDYVARLECEGELHDYFRSHGLEFASHRTHMTNAAGRLHEYYSNQELIDKVHGYYRPDFEIFGYGKSIDTLHPIVDMKPPANGRDFLFEFTKSFSGPLADRIRNIHNMQAMLKPHFWLDFLEFEIRRNMQPENDEAIRNAYRRLAEKPNRNWRFYSEVCRYLLDKDLYADFEVFARHTSKAAELTHLQKAAVAKLNTKEQR